MFAELALAGLCLGGIDILKNGNKGKIKKDWDLIMKGANAKNSFEKGTEEYFELLKIIQTEYGYYCIVSIPWGKSYDELEALIPKIQSGMGCVEVTMEWIKTSRCAVMRLIKVPFDMNAPFAPVQVKPNEIFVGSTSYYKDIISNMNINPHILVSGATGTGKSVFIFMLLLNLIANHSEHDVNIYLAQISDKKDLRLFRDAKQVRYFANNLEDATKMYAFVVAEMARRNKIINKYDDVNNIAEYNKKFPKARLPFIYVFADEFSFYMEDDRDSDKTAYMKMLCNSFFDSLVKQARSAGIFLVTGLQRPDKENLPPIFKAMMCTRVALAQSNTASSLVVVDSGDAVNLEPREALVLIGAKRYKITVPYIDMELIGAYVAENMTGENHYITLSQFDHLITEAESFQKPKNGGKQGKKDAMKGKATASANKSTDDNVIDMREAVNENSKPNKNKRGVID